MIVLVAPTKTLHFAPVPKAIEGVELSSCIFADEAHKIHAALACYSPAQLQALGKTSEILTAKTYHDIQTWGSPHNPTNPALYSYAGAVFEHINPHDFTRAEVVFAQQQFRILDGLYGLLSPLDKIEAYRLEMQAKLQVGEHKNLSLFWKDTLSTHLNTAFSTSKAVINLASKEYSKVIDSKQLRMPMIEVVFKEDTNGVLQTKGMYAKQARGLMARYCIKNKLMDPEKIKDFQESGYSFSQEHSTEKAFVFIR